MRMQKIIVQILVPAAVPLLLASGSSHACEDADLEQTTRLYEHMEFVSRTCNESGTVDDSLRCLEEEWGYTVQKMNKLPESCREMLREFEPVE